MFTNRIVLSMLTFISATSFFVSALYAAPPANKGKSDKVHGQKAADNQDSNVAANLEVTVSAGISVGDARKLASDYKMTGGKPLPPGIRKNLARGKPLPPGIEKTRLPGSFVNQLPHHTGFEWQRVGTDLVLVVSGSLVISDILEGVFD